MRDIITKLEELNVENPQLNEGLGELAHEAEKDHEVQMARSDLYKSAKYAVAIHKMLKDVSEMEGIDGWVAAKITKAADYLGAVKHYMEGEMMADVELAVVPVAGDMTDAMTMPQESVEVIEAEERDYICVHAKKGMYECSGTSSYAAAKKAAEHWGLKSTAGIDVHLADVKKTATESIEVTEDAERIIRVRNIQWDADNPADVANLPRNVDLKINVPYDADEDDIDDIVADELTDRYGFTHGGFETQFAEDMNEEDVIGDLIAKLEKNNRKEKFSMPAAKSQSDMMKSIVAKLGPGSDEKTSNKPAVSQQQAQAQANKAARSMGQDKTTGAPGGILRQSKFSEWSKK